MEQQLAADASKPPEGTEDLAQGTDTFTIEFTFAQMDENPANQYMTLDTPWEGWLNLEWNDIFGAIAPIIITEASDSEVRRAIQTVFLTEAKNLYNEDPQLKGKNLGKFHFHTPQIETVIVQFRALGLIEESIRKRGVRDAKTYWRLTKYGDNLMTKLLGIRREPPSDHLLIEAVLPPNRKKK